VLELRAGVVYVVPIPPEMEEPVLQEPLPVADEYHW
jgi:hypothetical protein